MDAHTPEAARSLALAKILEDGLVQASIKRRAGVHVAMRPVNVKGRRMIQISTFDGRRTDVKNYAQTELEPVLRMLLEGEVASISVGTAAEELRVQFSRKGRPVVHQTRRAAAMEPALRHDRVIERPFPEGEPDRLLQVIGLMTADGRIKADRQRKFIQINEFIRIVQESTDLRRLGAPPLRIVDFGCGNAYLSFALQRYLASKLGIPAELVGVDRTPEIIERNIAKAAELDAADVRFVTSEIEAFDEIRTADIVTALHACDTATDEALAKALEYEAKLIFVAPCCHHQLQSQPGFLKAPGPLRPIFADGILRERLGDLITDTLRALILRIAGYRVDVIEFTAPEHTAKNLLIRARRSARPGGPALLAEYAALKTEFAVTPYLEGIVPADLRRRLAESDNRAGDSRC